MIRRMRRLVPHLYFSNLRCPGGKVVRVDPREGNVVEWHPLNELLSIYRNVDGATATSLRLNMKNRVHSVWRVGSRLKELNCDRGAPGPKPNERFYIVVISVKFWPPHRIMQCIIRESRTPWRTAEQQVAHSIYHIHIAHCHPESRHPQVFAMYATRNALVAFVFIIPSLIDLETTSTAVEWLHGVRSTGVSTAHSSSSSVTRGLPPLLQPSLPVFPEIPCLANNKCIEECLRRRRARDSFAAPAHCGEEHALLRGAERLGNYWEHRDGLRRQEVHHRVGHIVARPKCQKWQAPIVRCAPGGARGYH